MNDKSEKKGNANRDNPIVLDDLLPKDDVRGGNGGRKLIFGAVLSKDSKKNKKKT